MRLTPGDLVCLDPSSGVRGDLPLMLTEAGRPDQVCCWLPKGCLGLVIATEVDVRRRRSRVGRKALLLLTGEGVGWTRAGLFLKQCSVAP